MKLTRALKRACKKAKITNFRFHDLRHTFASMLVQSGVDLYTVQKLLGHKDGRMTQRYAHLTQEKLASAVSRLEEICHNFVIPGIQKRGCKPQPLEFTGVPSGIRTRVTALKGRCPRPG